MNPLRATASPAPPERSAPSFGAAVCGGRLSAAGKGDRKGVSETVWLEVSSELSFSGGAGAEAVREN